MYGVKNYKEINKIVYFNNNITSNKNINKKK